MTDRELMQQALEALVYCEALNRDVQRQKEHAVYALRERLAQPEQEPFFTEANGFPQTFVSKDHQKQTIVSLTDQCAALVRERDELQKQVWRYEKNGVTCQTFRHTVAKSCAECNVQEDYTTPPRREWVGLTDEEVMTLDDQTHFHEAHDWTLRFARAIEAKLREKNA